MNEVMLNKKRGSAIGIMALILSSLAIFAAVMGVFNEKLYDELFQTGVLSSALVTGSIAQDVPVQWFDIDRFAAVDPIFYET